MGVARVRSAAIVLALLSLSLLYAPILVRLSQDWAHDDNYSHGFLIPPLALYFAWERRKRLAAVVPAPNLFGLALVGLGLAMLLAGLLGAELFLPRVSLIAVLAGALLFTLGWEACRILALPLAFLVLMIPI